MKNLVTMADRSCWDQSFIDAEPCVTTSRRVSCAGDFILELDGRKWIDNIDGLLARTGVRKSTSCVNGDLWSNVVDVANAYERRMSADCKTKTADVSNEKNHSRLAVSEERIYQNGHLAVDSVPTSSSSPCTRQSPVNTAAGDNLIILDSGTFSASSSGCSTSMTVPDTTSSVTSHSADSAVPLEQLWMTTTPAGSAYSRLVNFLPPWDAERLELTYMRLAACGFYYGQMSVDEATERLSRWPVGTFLLRDSSDRRYLLSVSVQTCRGTTSIRMSYKSGLFRLDCSSEQAHLMPTFDCPLRLVSYYVRLCSGASGTGNCSSSTPSSADNIPRNRHSYVLLETSGRRDTPVILTQPCRQRPSALTHFCRRTIQHFLHPGACADTDRDGAVDRLQLMPSLKSYLKDYPFDL